MESASVSNGGTTLETSLVYARPSNRPNSGVDNLFLANLSDKNVIHSLWIL